MTALSVSTCLVEQPLFIHSLTHSFTHSSIHSLKFPTMMVVIRSSLGKRLHPLHKGGIRRDEGVVRKLHVVREESSREGHQGLRRSLVELNHVHGGSVRGEAEGIKMIIFFETVSEMMRALAEFRLHIDMFIIHVSEFSLGTKVVSVGDLDLNVFRVDALVWQEVFDVVEL